MKLKALLLSSMIQTLPLASVPAADAPSLTPSGQNMYVIERTISAAGKLAPEELKTISQKSCGVLKEMGPDIQWVQSYVTGDKIYCVYFATSEDKVREHAKRGGFPADAVNKVSSVISPKTAE